MEKNLHNVLTDLENKLTIVNRVVFHYRVKKRKSGINEEERRAFASARIMQFKLKRQIKDLKSKLGVE